MRIHTNLTDDEIMNALALAIQDGHVTPDVRFAEFARYGSRSHKRAVDIQLGASRGGGLPEGYVNRYGQRQKTRRVRNGSGGRGESRYPGGELKWAATWEEWGWVLAEIFRADPDAKAGFYENAENFHEVTDGAFR